MDPDGITNPVARAAYKAARWQDEQNSIVDRRQVTLNGSDFTVKNLIINYLANAFNNRSIVTEDLINCEKIANLTDEEKDLLASKTSTKR